GVRTLLLTRRHELETAHDIRIAVLLHLCDELVSAVREPGAELALGQTRQRELVAPSQFDETPEVLHRAVPEAGLGTGARADVEHARVVGDETQELAADADRVRGVAGVEPLGRVGPRECGVARAQRARPRKTDLPLRDGVGSARAAP